MERKDSIATAMLIVIYRENPDGKEAARWDIRRKILTSGICTSRLMTV